MGKLDLHVYDTRPVSNVNIGKGSAVAMASPLENIGYYLDLVVLIFGFDYSCLGWDAGGNPS